jgi:predicted transposase/invertase (TIGR01784 family)
MREVGEDHGYKNFINKYTYYGTDLHAAQLAKGKKYSELLRTYQVTFCSYTVLPKRPDFVNRATLRFPDGEQLTDQLNVIVIEMSKLGNALKKSVSALTPLEMWSIFFQFAENSEYRDFINRIISEREEVAMASALLMEISRDEQEQARFRSRRIFETDLESNMLSAKEDGEMRKTIELAQKMKNRGISVEDIAEITGLTVDDILRL